jgi:hypothetical protein
LFFFYKIVAGCLLLNKKGTKKQQPQQQQKKNLLLEFRSFLVEHADTNRRRAGQHPFVVVVVVVVIVCICLPSISSVNEERRAAAVGFFCMAARSFTFAVGKDMLSRAFYAIIWVQTVVKKPHPPRATTAATCRLCCSWISYHKGVCLSVCLSATAVASSSSSPPPPPPDTLPRRVSPPCTLCVLSSFVLVFLVFLLCQSRMVRIAAQQ